MIFIKNEETVYNLLDKKRGITRQDIKKITGLAKTTIYDQLRKLELKNLAYKNPYSQKINGKRGAPSTLWFKKNEV